MIRRFILMGVFAVTGLIAYAAPPEIYENPCAPYGWEDVQNYYGRTATLVVNQPSQPGPFGVTRIGLGADVFDVLVSQPTFAAPTYSVDEASGNIPICTYWVAYSSDETYSAGSEWDEYSEASPTPPFPNGAVVAQKLGSGSANYSGEIFIDLGETSLSFSGDNSYMDYLVQAIAIYRIN